MFKSAVGGEELEFWEVLKFLSRSDVLLSYSNDFTDGSVHGVVITIQVSGNHQVAKSMCVTISHYVPLLLVYIYTLSSPVNR